MSNLSGEQPDIKYCPACGQSGVRNVPRSEMKSDNKGDKPTHTYECLKCSKGFEINQHR